MLLVDMSRVGAVRHRGSASKRELAAEVAALLAFSAIKNNDRVGLIIFTDEVERFVPPKKGKKHVLRVISEILTFRSQAAGAPTWPRARFPRARRAPARGRVPGLGFPGAGRSYERALRIAARRHDLVPVSVERSAGGGAAPTSASSSCEDPETGGTVLFDTSGPEAGAFNRAAREAVAARKALFKRLGMDAIDVRTDRPYLRALTAFFEARSRRLRH